MLGSKNKKWSIIIGGKTLDNTGLQKRNKIRKINWNANNDWDQNDWESENIKPDIIQEVPGKSCTVSLSLGNQSLSITTLIHFLCSTL